VSPSILAIVLAGTAPAAAFAQADAGPATDLSELRSVPAESMAASVTDPNWTAPRTAWGHPDLQGVWTSDDMRGVPRDLPAEFAGRDSLTEEEFLARAREAERGRQSALYEQTASARFEVGVRTFGFTSLVIEPENRRMPPMTEAGLARADPSRDRGTFGPGPFDTAAEDFTLYDRCITRGVIGSILPVIYGNGLRIVQSPDHVAISYEMIHDTRIIALDGRPRPRDELRQYMGIPRGHWDGDTLVIETANFTDETSIGGNGNGVRHSDQMKLTERLTRIDPEMIEYIARVDDPVTYTAPFTFRLVITSQPGYELYEYNCHEGNRAVMLALSGERAYERRVAEAAEQGLPAPPRETAGNIYGAPTEGAEVTFIGEGGVE
jgi:hypothetical protein